METKRTKIKIKSVSQLLTSSSVKATTQRIILTVIEIHKNNPYGKDYEINAIPFEIEVHNANINHFGITQKSVNEFAEVELIIGFFKKDEASPAQAKFLVNDLNFII